MQSEATETYSPGSLKSLTLAKDEIIRVKGTVSDLKDITKNRSHKKLEFKLNHTESDTFVSVEYIYEYQDQTIADKNIHNGDIIEVEGEFRATSRKANSRYQGQLYGNDDRGKPGFTPKSFISLDKSKSVETPIAAVSAVPTGHDKGDIAQQKMDLKTAHLNRLDKAKKDNTIAYLRSSNEEEKEMIAKVREAGILLRTFYYEWSVNRLDNILFSLKKTKPLDRLTGFYSLSLGKVGNEAHCSDFLLNLVTSTEKKLMDEFLADKPCLLNLNQFTLYAMTRFEDSGGLDVWSIDETGNLKHLQSAFTKKGIPTIPVKPRTLSEYEKQFICSPTIQENKLLDLLKASLKKRDIDGIHKILNKNSGYESLLDSDARFLWPEKVMNSVTSNTFHVNSRYALKVESVMCYESELGRALKIEVDGKFEAFLVLKK